MKFTPSTFNDILEISQWIAADKYHTGLAEWWLTGQGMLAFCIQDKYGPVMYVRIDDEGDFARLHIQFGPENIISKMRTAVAILRGLPSVIKVLKEKGKKGLVYESTSPSLIKFLQRDEFGFRHLRRDDYVLRFEEN